MTLGHSFGQADIESDLPPKYRHLVAKTGTKV